MELLLSTPVLTAVALIGLFMTSLFVISILIKRNDIADVAWGTGILIVGVVGYCSFTIIDDSKTGLLPMILLLLYTLWGVRLTYRIGRRNLRKSEEDYRYKRWREEWGKWFYLRSYFQVYLLQGLLMLVVGSPLLIVGAIGTGMYGFNGLMYVGLMIWIIGYVFEVVGDFQLDHFLGNPANRGHVMQSGLWRYTRHPNYFGEVTMWWGIWLMVSTLSGAWLALISPLMITFLILKVSGIPLLEEKFAGRPDWEAYKARTSVFFPWFPKSHS